MSLSPGPWRWNSEGELVSADGTIISPPNSMRFHPEGEAIAAVPEMVELLRSLEWHLESGYEYWACPSCEGCRDAKDAGDDGVPGHRPDCKLASLLARIEGKP